MQIPSNQLIADGKSLCNCSWLRSLSFQRKRSRGSRHEGKELDAQGHSMGIARYARYRLGKNDA
jgi:hypothetical protein